MVGVLRQNTVSCSRPLKWFLMESSCYSSLILIKITHHYFECNLSNVKKQMESLKSDAPIMAHMKWAASTHTQHLGFAPSSISRRSRRCREAGVVLRICEMMEVDTHFTLCVRLISLRFLRFPEEFLDFDLFFRENDTLCHRHTHCIHFVVTAVIEFVRPQNPRDPAFL